MKMSFKIKKIMMKNRTKIRKKQLLPIKKEVKESLITMIKKESWMKRKTRPLKQRDWQEKLKTQRN